jgi:starch phosphorylase
VNDPRPNESATELPAEGASSEVDWTLAQPPEPSRSIAEPIVDFITNETNKKIDSRTMDLPDEISITDRSIMQEETPIIEDATPHDSFTDHADNNSAQVDTLPVTTSSRVIPKIIPIDDPRVGFNLAAFKQAFVDNLQHVQGKTLQTATLQECYRVLACMVRDRLRQFSPPEGFPPSSRIVVALAIELTPASYLETSLVNLGIVDQVHQALQDLGRDLNQVLAQEQSLELNAISPGEAVEEYLEALATARNPAIGYGIYYSYNALNSSDDGLSCHPGSIEELDAIVTVKLGGHTETYIDEQRVCRVRWIPQDTIVGTPYDMLIPGYKTDSVSKLRLWKADALDDCQQPYTLHQERHNEELYIKQWYFLVSCAVQDIIQLHLKSGSAIETLHDRFALHIHDVLPALAIAELMYWLVDRYELPWEQAWLMTQTMTSCTVPHRLLDEPDTRWSVKILSQLLPRHLEIIYEINRRFLDEVQTRYPNDQPRIRRMSLIDETGDRFLRTAHLICVGSHAISGGPLHHAQSLQRLLPDFSEIYPGQFIKATHGVSLRRWLMHCNPRLASIITQWLGDDWVVNPQTPNQLEQLVTNLQFCSNWWQVRQENKQEVANVLHQQMGIDVNLNSLFDVQVTPIQTNQRHLLNLLHAITLYIRLKANASTDTILRFAHRSVPRTCIYVGQTAPNDAIAQSINDLMQAVAITVNSDPEVQGRLQIVVLANVSAQLIRHLYAAADLSEYLPLVDQTALNIINWRVALNGAVTIGTFDSANIELQQAVGAKNCFLFGMHAAEVNHLYRTYEPLQYYTADSELQQAINLIASGYFSFGDTDRFKALGNWLLTQDPTLILANYPSYMDCQARVSQSYQDQKNWTRMSILTAARMSKFSSDRTISDYRTIWRIQPIAKLTS